VTRRYWYELFYVDCPVCGNGSCYRERRYTRKPKRAKRRVHYEQLYDGCMDWQFA
jgi:hypothetical protein